MPVSETVPQHDLTWLKPPACPPARDDLGHQMQPSNPSCDSTRKLTLFAQNIAHAIPPLKNAKFTGHPDGARGITPIIPVSKGQATARSSLDQLENRQYQPMLT